MTARTLVYRHTFRPFLDPAVRYHLRMYTTGRTNSYGHTEYAYRFSDRDGVIFEGADFYAPSGNTPATAARHLMAFLTLRPGDTDRDYFEAYTPRQFVFANSYACEVLAAWCADV